MKKIIIFFLLLCVTQTISAEATFYYSDSKKIPLYENSSKAIIISSKSHTKTIQRIPSIKSIRSITCDDYEVTVVEKKDTATLENVKKMLPSGMTATAIYPCYKNELGCDLIPTSYIYVELKSNSDYFRLNNIAKKLGCRVINQNKFLPLWYTLCLVKDTGEDSVEIANKIMETKYFSNACPAFEMTQSISYDPSVLNQWGLYNSEYDNIDISVSEAWNYSTGRGVTVAIIDNGIDLSHEDLSDNLCHDSYDAATNSCPSKIYQERAGDSHGTHCAGIIGAVRNNNTGIVGVAPESTLMSVSVDFGSADTEAQLADGINWAWKNGADIISCSWGGWQENALINQAIDNALTNGRRKLGCLTVFAAGNSFGGSQIQFPANSRDEVFAVGNIESNGIWNFTSCTGDQLLVCAPGTNILSTTVNNSYEEMSGTSMACPHVSGVLALMLELDPNLSISKAREIIAKSTKRIGHLPYSTNRTYGKWNEYYGYGLVDASKAVKNTLNIL